MKRSAENTTSKLHREQGNKKWALALVNGIPEVVVESRLREAIREYNRALSAADSADDKASAYKNLGLAYNKSANLKTQSNEDRFRSFVDSLVHYLEAVRTGQGKESEWVSGCIQKYKTCEGEAFEFCRSSFPQDPGSTVSQLFKILGSLPLFLEPSTHSIFLCDWYIKTSTFLFQRSVVYWEDEDHKSALSFLHDASQLLCKIQELYNQVLSACPPAFKQFLMASSRAIANQREIEELKGDIAHQMVFVETNNLTSKGDALLRSCLDDFEELPIDLVWEVVDLYKAAILKATHLEKDIEGEAVASVKLGDLYLRVLKQVNLAKKYLEQAQKLLISLEPMEFDDEPWYAQYNANIRNLAIVPDMDDDTQKEIEADIVKFQKCSTGHSFDFLAGEFLALIYKEYPSPTATGYVLPEVGPHNKPKVLLKALVHYHPDKHTQGSKKWKALCWQITINLNNYYDRIK